MTSRKLFLALALYLLASLPTSTWAADEPSPLVLVMEKSADAPEMGLAWIWLERGIEKRTAKEAQAFAERVTEAEIVKLFSESLSCVGLPAGTARCREVIQFEPPAGTRPGKEGPAIAQMLSARGTTQAVVAKVLTRFTGKTYSSRVIMEEVTVAKSNLQFMRRRGAVYVARVPAEIENQGKNDPSAFDTYWFDGENPRFLQDLSASVPELKAMIDAAWSDEALASWVDLPQIRDVGGPERFNCPGLACSGVRVLKDSGTRTWLVLYMKRSTPGIIRGVVSLDPNAAAVAANMGWLSGAND